MGGDARIPSGRPGQFLVEVGKVGLRFTGSLITCTPENGNDLYVTENDDTVVDYDQDNVLDGAALGAGNAVAGANGMWRFFRNDEPVEVFSKVIGGALPGRVIDLRINVDRWAGQS